MITYIDMLYVQCLICGCNFFNKEVITNETLFKKIFPYEKWHYKYNEDPELLIENTSNGEDIDDKLSNSIRTMPLYDWLEKIVAITPKGLVDITNVEDNSHRLVFFDDNGNEYDPYWVNDETYKQKPYIMHKSCYQLLKKNGYDMSYNSFLDVDNPEKLKIKKKGSNIVNKDFNENIELNKFNIDYGIVNKYIGEYKSIINYVAYIYDKYLLENPLKSKKNAIRILELKIPLKKIQNDEVKKKGPNNEVKRKGPSDSATIFDIGTTKIGNDKCIWQIVKNKNGVKKWQRIKQEEGFNNDTNSTHYYKYIKYKTKYYNLIKKLETN
jgi:hypothetical protein